MQLFFLLAFILGRNYELHHLFFIAEILRFVVGRAQIALIADEEAEAIPQEGSHRLAVPMGLAAQPFILLSGQSDGYRVCARQDKLPLGMGHVSVQASPSPSLRYA